MKTLSSSELRSALETCLAVPRWIDEVAALAPFDSTEALLRAARDAATPLSRAEVDAALAGHPRIGEAPGGDSPSERFSRREQSSGDAADAGLAASIAAGNRDYEERFGRVFLIRAAGRSRAEILAELRRRLALDDATEAGIVATELRDIALLRLAALVADEARSRITTHVLDAVAGLPAVGVPVRLEHREPLDRPEPSWRTLATAITDADGRVTGLGPAELPAGRYRLTFDTGSYFASSGRPTLYPEVQVTIEVTDPAAHYHVPLLLSPFAYSTYRGS